MVVEKITFANDRGERLAGILHHPAAAQPSGAVILCHGMESNKNSEKLVYLGQALAEHGILALRFDFACAGESSGDFAAITHRGEVADLRAAFKLVTQRHKGRTAILGSSMGGTVAILFAAEEPAVAALVTIAAPIHPENFPQRILSPRQIEEWRQSGFTLYHNRRIDVTMLQDLENIDVLAAARAIQCPVLILHGDRDEVIPVAEAYELTANLKGRKRLAILQGADHRLSNPQAMQRALNESLHYLLETVG